MCKAAGLRVEKLEKQKGFRMPSSSGKSINQLIQSVLCGECLINNYRLNKFFTKRNVSISKYTLLFPDNIKVMLHSEVIKRDFF